MCVSKSETRPRSAPSGHASGLYQPPLKGLPHSRSFACLVFRDVELAGIAGARTGRLLNEGLAGRGEAGAQLSAARPHARCHAPVPPDRGPVRLELSERGGGGLQLAGAALHLGGGAARSHQPHADRHAEWAQRIPALG